MVDQNWEYCTLALFERNAVRAGRTEDAETDDVLWGYDAVVTYMGERIVERRLAHLHEPREVNPFEATVGRLGARGWELVSVQHGVIPGTSPLTSVGVPSVSGHIMWGSIVAYFKRPVVEGRAVDEPPLPPRES